MLVTEQDYGKIHQFLQEQRWNNGYEYVAYPNDGLPVNKYQLVCFSTDLQAQEYCFKNMTDMDTYAFLGIRSAYRTMSEGTHGLTPMIERNGAIDIAAMVDAHYQKLENEQLSQNKKGVVMNEENRVKLIEQVLFSGFGNEHRDEIRAILLEELPNSTIKHKEFVGKDLTVESRLNFRKSEESDRQFYNSFSSGLYRGNDVIVKPQLFKLDHTYYMDENGSPLRKNVNPTRVEVQNLLLGRAIRKDLVEKIKGVDHWRNAWIKMDFNQVDNKGRILREEFPDYNLHAHLEKIPFLKELEDPNTFGGRIQSLEKGNQQLFTAYRGEHEIKIFLEADPKLNDVLVYDYTMKRTTVEQISSELDRMEQGIGNEVVLENNVKVASGMEQDQNTRVAEQKDSPNLSAGNQVEPSQKDNVKQDNAIVPARDNGVQNKVGQHDTKNRADQKTADNQKTGNKAKPRRQRM